MVVVEATDVVKEYESGETVRALKGVNFEIEAGEFVAIVGPSGSGKSTLLNLVGLLDTPTSGTVRVAGEDIEDHSDRERTSVRKSVVGFVFQSYYLIPTLTARENVVVPCLLDQNPAEAEQRAVDLLERVGLGDRLDHYPDELSGGQKQRVAIARSLINEPDVLLTDEPTGNLDRETGERVLDEFDRVTDEGVAVVTVTHDEYVASFADRVLHLVDGELGTDAPSVETVGGGAFE